MTKQLGALISLVIVHLLVGRVISIPYGIAVLGKWYRATMFILFLDMLEICAVFYILDKGVDSFRLKTRLKLVFKKIRRWWESYAKRKEIFRQERNFHSRLLKRAHRFGALGVIIIASIPFSGGGIWSGVLLARLLPLSGQVRLLLLLTGSFIGCIFLSLGVHGVLELVKALYSLLT